MRVIAGSARGRELKAPKGMGTRPMMDIVKGSLFNMLESLGGIGGAVVLDLYAGSGSLGIEALSRGADQVDFVEQNREACKVIGENLERLGFGTQGRVIQKSVEQVMSVAPTPALTPCVTSRRASRSAREGESYDLVFMDAPYPAEVSSRILTQLAQWPQLNDEALVCIGHHKHETLPDVVGLLSRIKYRCFGASCISIYRNLKSETPQGGRFAV